MSQGELIKATGLSRSTIGRIENCEKDVDIPQIKVIADALGVDWIRLLSDAQQALDADE